ncbi:thiol reductant ABC exporter subunit CydC [Lipingzhangella sp. LS1_29]|uniref:Thiol reductant ABC exporter subunit CydC n=1 Tax=Lipingzhangella rawalii TaxID=2055835 RepID=A0ABU2H5G3_9ACTN|nr:thiol reductant ABC exporter subunit CydC [Lipingzhangella rawalii]
MVARLIPVLSPHWLGLVRAGVTGVGTQLAGVSLLAVAAWLIARAAQQPAIDALMLAVVAVRGLALARGGLRYVERITGHDAALRVLAELRGVVYGRMVDRGRDAEAVPSHVSSGPGDGDLSERHTRLVQDVDAVHETLLRVLLPATITLVVGLVTVPIVGGVAPAAGAVLAVGLLLSAGVLPIAAGWWDFRIGRSAWRRRTELAACGLDLLRGAEDLTTGDADRDHETVANQRIDQLARIDRRAAWHAAALGTLSQLCSGLTVVGVLVAGTRSTDLGPGGGTVTLAVLALTSLACMETAAPLPEAGRVWARSLPALRRLATALCPVSAPPAPAPSGPFAELLVRRVTVRADGDGTDAQSPPVLDQVDLRLTPGRSVVVVGASGSGKSTLLRTVCGEVIPTHGDVLLRTSAGVYPGGAAIAGYARGLTDDAHIFTTTIRANLLLARPDADWPQLRDAARRARLLDWIESLPQGWETEVGELGRGLSGGQRRRLLLARALLSEPEILVLDEPTRGLPPKLATQLLSELVHPAHRGADRTVLLATHAVAGVDAADEVLVLDRGQVRQRGTPRQLSRVPGPFAELRSRGRGPGSIPPASQRTATPGNQ